MYVTVRSLILLLALIFAGGCVSPPFVSEGIKRDLTPDDVLSKTRSSSDAESPEAAGQVVKVMWGGVVIGSSNNTGSTTFEILSYPLDYLQRPDTNGRSTGRFLAVTEGYLEAADFPAGCRVTAIGTIGGTENGQIGDASYRYALLELDSATDLHRWSAQDYYNSNPIGIGIGISISR